MCAGNEVTRQSSCKGHSGGPLIIFDSKMSRYVQVGIVAGGISHEDCGNDDIPGVYNRLDHPEIIGFIENLMGGMKFKLIKC